MAETLVHPSLLKPSRIDTPSASKIAATENNISVAPPPPGRELKAKAIRVQLRAMQVMDGLQGIWGTDLGAATGVYLITSVVDGMGEEPVVFQGKTYNNISNGDMLPLGTTPDPSGVLNLYLREGEMPRLLSFNVVVLRSNEQIRQIATVFSELRADDRYKTLSDIIKTAVTATNPAFGIVWQAAEEIVGLIGNLLRTKPDEQLGYYQANFTNAFDNLGEGRHPSDRPTMLVDKIRFSYQIDALAE